MRRGALCAPGPRHRQENLPPPLCPSEIQSFRAGPYRRTNHGGCVREPRNPASKCPELERALYSERNKGEVAESTDHTFRAGATKEVRDLVIDLRQWANARRALL